jgi:hypothetical protein
MSRLSVCGSAARLARRLGSRLGVETTEEDEEEEEKDVEETEEAEEALRVTACLASGTLGTTNEMGERCAGSLSAPVIQACSRT